MEHKRLKLKLELKVKANDWSVNLEDSYYEQNPDELLKEALEAVISTAHGYYVNLVTPGGIGNPELAFIPGLIGKLEEEDVPVKKVQYIDECGCGGYVTRVYR